MKKKVIVGAGIAGIIAAYFERKKGNQVFLVDSDKRAGGLLKSDFFGGHYFDYGTHILPETGVIEIDEFLFSGLNNGNCIIGKRIKAGNYFRGQMNDKSCYVDASALLIGQYNQGCMELLLTEENDSALNLENHMKNKYGETFYTSIFLSVIKKYMGTEPSELSSKVDNFFDMSMLLAFNNSVTKRLGNIALYNGKLGHHIREDGVTKYYPKEGGVGGIIENLLTKLRESGVTVLLGEKIKSINHENGVVKSLEIEDQVLEVDSLLWTLPNSFLLKLCDINRHTEPPEFRKTGLFDFVFDKPLKSESTFINVYDTTLFSGRITLYQNLTQEPNFSCTVEVLTDQSIEHADLLEIIKNELRLMGLTSDNTKCLFSQFRAVGNGFPILSTTFMNEQDELNTYCSEHFSNISFIGRASSKTFFMPEVLVEVYQESLLVD